MIRLTRCLVCLLFFLVGCGESNQSAIPLSGPTTLTPINQVSGELRSRLTGELLEDVRVGWEGTNLFTRTDQNGRFRLGTRIGFKWLTLSGDSVIPTRWKPKAVMHVWTKARNESAERRYLMERPPIDSDPLDDPDLTERAREILRDGDFFRAELPAVDRPGFVHKQLLQPPATVRVYRRGPENDSCQGRVDVIPLEEYVRGVVPHEWIASWHEESLRAGAIAARSYAWGWILAGGKYNCADLDDSTRSQVYEDTRNERADVAVMSTSGIGIYDPERGQVVTSEYSAENADPTDSGVCEPLCTGETLFGHGRGMCQWGTSRWSSRQITEVQAEVLADCAVHSPAPIVGTGQIAEWMVAHYFPGKYTTELEETGASLELSQSLERVDPLRCALPERGFGCSDFVPEGRSQGIFDTFLGQSTLITYSIVNEGASAATDVVWTMQKPDGVRLDISSGAGAIVEADGFVTGRFARLEAGGRVAIEVRITATNAGRLVFRPFITQIENQYDKRDWDAEPVLNVGQTYNDGDLRQLTEIDVFNPKLWDFLSDQDLNPMGWYGDSVTYAAVDEGMKVSGINDGPVTIESPYLYGERSGVNVVLLRSRDPVTLAVRYADQDVFETLGTGSGTRVFSLSTSSPVYQFRLSGASPFTVESVGLRSSIAGEGGTGASVPDQGSQPMQTLTDSGLMEMTDSSVTGRVDGGLMPLLDGGLHTQGNADASISSGVRSSGSCMYSAHEHVPNWLLCAGVALCLLRRRTVR